MVRMSARQLCLWCAPAACTMNLNGRTIGEHVSTLYIFWTCPRFVFGFIVVFRLSLTTKLSVQSVSTSSSTERRHIPLLVSEPASGVWVYVDALRCGSAAGPLISDSLEAHTAHTTHAHTVHTVASWLDSSHLGASKMNPVAPARVYG